jgi:hypothetical protein
MATSCNALLEEFGFTEDSENNRQLRYAVTAEIQGYLKSN